MSDTSRDNIPSQNTPMEPEGEGTRSAQSPFEAIRHVDGHGEFWLGRELAKVLGYNRWGNFQQVLQKVEVAITNSGFVTSDHVLHMQHMVSIGSGAQRKVDDVRLTRYACFLTAQNADPNKEIVALAQTYFAVQTRKQEIAELREAQTERLELRTYASETNKQLAEAAHDAGVPSKRFGIFQDSGYKGLYNGLGAAEIKEKKDIPAKGDILDHMGSVELGANIFRITQAQDALRRNNVQGEERANTTHYEVGRSVRDYLEKQGSTMPEDLPAEPTIKPLLDEQRRKSKRKQINQSQQGQASLFDEPQTERDNQD